jgi:asparagine synthase (glutamine-hydrolysing)
MESENWVLTYNGEIFNSPELRIGLEKCGHTFKSQCDTETLLHCLEEYGLEPTLEKINGFFAFGAYNKRSGEFFLVRDRLGIKPLFYYFDGKKLAFASVPAALVRTLQEKWSLDFGGLEGLLLLGACYGNKTLFEGIHRLPAASFLKWIGDHSAPSTKKFWSPQLRGGSLMDTLVDAVNIRRMGDVPMAVFFSGGVDSTFLAGVLRDIEAMHLISEEETFARDAASSLGVKLQTIACGEEDHCELLRDYASHTGEASMASPIPHIVAKALRSRGFKVAFSANGADELFYGYSRIPIPGLSPLIFEKHKYEQLPANTLREQLLQIFRNPAHFSIPARPAQGGSIQRLQDTLNEECLLPGFGNHANYRWLELQTYVLFDLNATLDFASMGCGLEVRTPFLDYRVVERLLSTPPEHLVTHEEGRKSPLKRALRDFGVPESCFRRNKFGFSLKTDFAQNLETLQFQAADCLSARGLLKISAQTVNDRRSWTYLMSTALALEVWCKEWIDSGIVFYEGK